MGVLVRIEEASVFETLWECFTAAYTFGLQVKGRKQNQRAEAIEDELVEHSQESDGKIRVKCKGCGERTELRNETVENFWRVDKFRTLKTEDGKAEPAVMFFEDDPFSMLREHVDAVVPVTPRRRDYNKLNTILDDAEANWKGSEVEMRRKLMALVSPSETKTEAKTEEQPA